ncbi:MAG: CHAT domain-containing protein [Armatimonadetes bacterium]|nr:CHAT domain-containing protein [Armatimonadota bacterium]
MDTPSLIRLLESDASRPKKRAALRAAGPVTGINEAAFRSVAGLLGSDVRRARELASFWPEFVSHGDDRSYALRTKAVFLRLQGKWVESASAFRQAGQATKRLPDRYAFQTGAVDSLGRAGKVATAVRLGRRLSSELSDLGETALAARVKLNTGNALLWQDRYREARSWLEQAAPELEAAGLDSEAAAAKLGLSTSHLFGGSPREALRWAQAAAADFGALGADHHSLLASLNNAQALHLTGRHDEALDLLLEARAQLDAEPFEKGRCFEFAGHAYLALNLASEAADCFREALKIFRNVDALLNRANCLMGLGAAAELLEFKRQPSAFYRRARVAYLEVGNRTWAAAALSRLARLLCARGFTARALEAASAAVAELRTTGSKVHLAEAELTLAECLIASRQDSGAPLQHAKRLIARNGYVHLEWRVHWLAAKSTSGRSAEAHFARMVRSIIEARLLTSSTLSRAAFLKDKAGALSEYIELLLANPTPKRIERVVSVIRSTRSAALVDEILSGRNVRQREDLVRRLDELRQELRQFASEGTPGLERRAVIGQRAVHALRRRWAEVRRDALSAASGAPLVETDSPTTILIQTRESLFSICNRRLRRLGCSAESLKNDLKWLRFDLLAPMADPKAKERQAVASLRAMKSSLGLSIPSLVGALAISPDAALWQVPWQAVLNAEECAVEPVLLPNAGFLGNEVGAVLNKDARVAIWAGESSHLPHIREEAEHVHALFPGARVARTLAEVRACMEEGPWDLIHLASHAGLNVENPMFSLLSFPDGPLLADDIARSPLQVRHICLSACDTGSLSIVNTTEPDGIARAFLARGASSVLATSWPVDDRTAKEFMKDYYEGLVEGRTLVDALAEARRRCRTRNPHPYFWGCWVMFGGYR